MAIDPTIALGVQPLASPLEAYGKALQVQNLATQGKMGQIGLQEAQTALSQQQALNKAYADPANRNPDGSINYNAVANSLAQAGAGAQIPGVIKGGMQAQQAQMQFQEEHLKLLQQHNDKMADHIQGLMADKALTPDKVKATMDQALQEGDLDQQHYQQALQTMPQTTDPNALKAWLAQQATTVYATGSKLQQFIPQTKAETIGGQIVPVSTTQATGEVKAGAPIATTPTSELGKINADEKAGLMTADQAAAARKKATYIQPNVFAMMNSPQMGGKGFDPTQPLGAAQEAQARAIADGAPMLTVSSRNPFALPINARAQQIYADAHGGDMTGFGTLKGTLGAARQSFSAGGKNGQTLIALDTAVHHFDALSKAADALNNGDTVGLNAASNYLSKQFGDPKVTNFDTVKALAADEFTKVAAGATSGEAEREAMQKLFSSANSPAQLKQAIQQAQVLMAGKVQGLDTAYKSAYGSNKSIMERVSPETQSVMGRANQSIPTPQGLPKFSSPSDPGFANLPSGAHFIGPDGVERIKH